MTATQSPKPLATPLAMSSTRLPERPAAEPTPNPSVADQTTNDQKAAKTPSETGTSNMPKTRPRLPSPKLRFEVLDLSHKGAARFQDHISIARVLPDVISSVLHHLYELPGTTASGHLPATAQAGKDSVSTTSEHGNTKPSSAAEDRRPHALPPPIRSVTIVLSPMGGVAFTRSTELDEMHKEIHISMPYIASQAENEVRYEMLGVLVHEMVHVWQYFKRIVDVDDDYGNSLRSTHGSSVRATAVAPSGLTEGIADYVRLKAGYAPKHWTRKPGSKWDDGYEKTGYFLDWCEVDCGVRDGVRRLNALLREDGYGEGIWVKVFGKSVGELWKGYCQAWKDGERK